MLCCDGRLRLPIILLFLWLSKTRQAAALLQPGFGQRLQKLSCWNAVTANEARHSLPRNLRTITYSTNKAVGGGESYPELQDPVLRLPLMEAKFASQMEDPEYNDDNKHLEKAIADAKTAAEFGVRKSQSEFYEAVSSCDMDAMSDVWSTSSQIRCVHPGMASVEGRKGVMDSWQRYFSVPVPPSSSSSLFTIQPERTQIEICGLVAICSCVEKTQGGGQLEALNIYKRENGSWKMILHQAGPIMSFT